MDITFFTTFVGTGLCIAIMAWCGRKMMKALPETKSIGDQFFDAIHRQLEEEKALAAAKAKARAAGVPTEPPPPPVVPPPPKRKIVLED